MTLIFSGYLGKWETEIKTPYLYLIPDSPVKNAVVLDTDGACESICRWSFTLCAHRNLVAGKCVGK